VIYKEELEKVRKERAEAYVQYVEELKLLRQMKKEIERISEETKGIYGEAGTKLAEMEAFSNRTDALSDFEFVSNDVDTVKKALEPLVDIIFTMFNLLVATPNQQEHKLNTIRSMFYITLSDYLNKLGIYPQTPID